MFYFRALFLNFVFSSGSFRFGRNVSRVEAFSSAEEKHGLSKIFKKSIAISTSMDTTAKSEDKKEFKFKIRVKTRVLSVVI
jgi:hypothetical protein